MWVSYYTLARVLARISIYIYVLSSNGKYIGVLNKKNIYLTLGTVYICKNVFINDPCKKFDHPCILLQYDTNHP